VHAQGVIILSKHAWLQYLGLQNTMFFVFLYGFLFFDYRCTENHVPCLLLYGLFHLPDFSKDLQASYQERVCMTKLYCFAGAADISNSREIFTLSLPG